MSKKVLSIVMTLVLLVATLCVSAGSAAALSGTVYFQVPSDWTGYTKVYCHYWGDGVASPEWQSDAEICTKVSDDGIFGYGLPEGEITGMVFSVDLPETQTSDIAVTADSVGKVATVGADGKVTWEAPKAALDEVKAVAVEDKTTSAAPADGKISGTIYFEIPEAWKNFTTVYCHYWTDAGEGPSWQSDDEICTKVNDKLYSITLPEGAWTKAIFSNDNGLQTGDTALSENEIGKVMYYTGNKVENPVNGEMVDEAAWKDYEEPTSSSADETSSVVSKADTEKSNNNMVLYIVIAAVVVVLIVVIVVVASKKKKKD